MFVSQQAMKIPVIKPIVLRCSLTAILIFAGLLLALHWRPGRQVRLHQQHFLRAVEDRNWKKVSAFVAPDFKDRWRQTRSIVLARLPQVFANFLVCGIESSDSLLLWQDGTGVVQSRIRIVGSGGPIAQYIMEEAANLKQPFSFIWRHQSWKPWDWTLVEVDQPELQIPEDTEFQ